MRTGLERSYSTNARAIAARQARANSRCSSSTDMRAVRVLSSNPRAVAARKARAARKGSVAPADLLARSEQESQEECDAAVAKVCAHACARVSSPPKVHTFEEALQALDGLRFQAHAPHWLH